MFVAFCYTTSRLLPSTVDTPPRVKIEEDGVSVSDLTDLLSAPSKGYKFRLNVRCVRLP